MKLEVHKDHGVFERLRPEWNALVNRSSTNTVFSTWEWLATWWEVYQPGALHLVTVRDGHGRLAAIAPWFISPDNVLRCIGCVDVTDYVDLIIDQELTQPALQILCDYICADSNPFKQVALCNIPANSPTLSILPQLLGHHQIAVDTEVAEVCPVIELPETWEDYLMLLDKKQRHEVRRKLRRAYGAGVEIQWYTVDQSHDLNAELATFLDLMAASDSKKQAFLEEAHNVEFFRLLAHRMLEAGWLRLSFISVNGDPAAAYFSFEFNGRFYLYNSGIAVEPHGHLSPGIVLLSHLIGHAIEQKLQVFDFLRGNEVYKYRMGGQDTHIYNLMVNVKDVAGVS